MGVEVKILQRSLCGTCPSKEGRAQVTITTWIGIMQFVMCERCSDKLRYGLLGINLDNK